MSLVEKIIIGHFIAYGEGEFKTIENMNYQLQEGDIFDNECAPTGKPGFVCYKIEKVERKVSIPGNLHIYYYVNRVSAFRLAEDKQFLDRR